MKKRLNKIIAILLTSCLALSSMSINSFAAVGTGARKSTNRGTGQTSLYQDGSLSAAYSENEALEKYSAPAAGTYEGDLYQALKKYEDKINVSKYRMPEEEALEAYRCLINANPDLFFVSNSLNWYREIYCEDCGGYVAEALGGGWIVLDDTFEKGMICNHNGTHHCYYALTHWSPNYIENSKSQLSAMTANFNAAVEKALSGIDDSMSQLEKALYLHDYIVKSNAYDYENFENDTVPNVSHSAYGPLVLHTSVCDGYSLAYSYLLKKCGINARLVTSSSMAHAWNAVEIDGSWYFVDLTRDDPTYAYSEIVDDVEIFTEEDVYSLVGHSGFLASEALWRKTEYSNGCYTGWAQTDIQCNNTKYDEAIWKDNFNEYGYCDGYWYYLHEDFNSELWAVEDAAIMRTEDPTLAGDVFLSLLEYKNSWGFSDGSYYPGIHAMVSVYAPNKQLFFNSGTKIYVVDLTDPDKNLRIYYNLDNTALAGMLCIFGLIVIDDFLYFGCQEDPYARPIVVDDYLSEFVLGNVNNDTTVVDGVKVPVIDSKDALQILKYSVDIPVPGFIRKAADVTKDGIINSKDALQVLKYSVGLITEF